MRLFILSSYYCDKVFVFKITLQSWEGDRVKIEENEKEKDDIKKKTLWGENKRRPRENFVFFVEKFYPLLCKKTLHLVKISFTTTLEEVTRREGPLTVNSHDKIGESVGGIEDTNLCETEKNYCILPTKDTRVDSRSMCNWGK